MNHKARILLFILCIHSISIYAQNEADQLAQQVLQARAEGKIDEAIRLNSLEIEIRKKDPHYSKLFLASSIHSQAINYSTIN